METMSKLDDLISGAMPLAEADDELLETLYDSLDKGIPTPQEAALVQRLTLMGVRKVDRRSKRTQLRVDFLWYAMLLLMLALGVITGMIYIHTNGMRDLFPALTGLSLIGTGLAVMRQAVLAIH